MLQTIKLKLKRLVFIAPLSRPGKVSVNKNGCDFRDKSISRQMLVAISERISRRCVTTDLALADDHWQRMMGNLLRCVPQ